MPEIVPPDVAPAAGAVRAGPSIRTLSAAVVVLIGVLVGGAIASLVWSGHTTRRTTREGLVALRSQALVDGTVVGLLTHRRLSDLYTTLREREIDEARDTVANETREALRSASALTTDPRERALLAVASRQLDAYFRARDRLEATNHDSRAIDTGVRPFVDRVTDSLGTLRAIHRNDVERAYQMLERDAILSDVAGGAAVALLLVALVMMLVAVRGWIVNPLLALYAVIERSRDGELGARAPEGGTREMREVAHAYNAMADTIAAQHDGRVSYLAGVAHDLRTPLGTMKTGIAVVRACEGSERSRRTLALLDRQVDRMARMLGDLLDSTRIEAGRLELQRASIDLGAHTRETVELLAPSYPSHSISADTPERPLVICADPLRVDQVLGNLLTNALKYSPGGGRVEVRVRQSERDAILEVKDHGIGMTREEMRDLFAPFRRRAPAVAPGAGLGLSVVRRIVEAHAGRIEVESEPGQGSTFRVMLPLSSPMGEHTADEPPLSACP